ncbi:MAG TPA: hypothetical protein VHC94_16490 [Nitrobacter sp.]|jgi:hypothetical protein|nr:hypothetical protein [Nitrobacter sp.]
MSRTSNRLVLGIGLAGLIAESVFNLPALATDKVSLFKVITTRDEIVIGLSEDDLAHIAGHDAGGIARELAAKGSMSVWEYGVRRAEAGALEEAPLRKIGLLAGNSLRVEPYISPLKVVPMATENARN